MPKATCPSAPSAAHYAWLAVGMLVLTVYGSLLPFQFEGRTLDDALTIFREMQYFEPSPLELRGDWVISFVQYLILSFLAMAAVSVDHPRDIGIGAAVLLAPACVALSLALEFAQVFFPPRTVSTNDLWVESLGGLAGIGVWLVAGQRLTDWFRRVTVPQGIERLTSRLLPIYLAALLVVELMPFDVVLSPTELSVKSEEG